MNNIRLVITITERTLAEQYVSLCNELHIPITLSIPGRGTAQSNVLDYFGLEKTEKRVLFSIVAKEKARILMRDLSQRLKIARPGNGVAAVLPIQSVGSSSTMNFFLEDTTTNTVKEGSQMLEAPYELIITIANNGYTDWVMEAARSAQAYGGTIVHAKGTGMEHAEKFFGVSLATEREMVFIIAKKANKVNIMKAIMQKAGMHTEAHSIVFSMPVTHVEGLHLPDDDITDDL